MDSSEYIAFLENFDYYISQPLHFVKKEKYDFPYAAIGELHYRFRHYHTEEEASIKWNERKQRINYDNIFYIMTEKEGCSYTDMQRFDALPFKNKVLLTHKPYPELKCAYYIKGFEEVGYCLTLSEYVKGHIWGKRYYDYFDFVEWFNKGISK